VDLKLTLREKWAIRSIYSGITAVVVAAQSMAFDHARLWAGRHATPGAEGWEGLAFGIGIEMPAVIGLLLLQVWSKIAPRKPKTVPRLLLGGALLLSFTVQQMYAGPHASASTRFVAGFPSVLAFVFVHILFMVIELTDRIKREMAEEAAQAELKQTRQRLGLGDIAAPPTLTTPRPAPDMTTTPDLTPALRRPETTPLPASDVSRHDEPTAARQDTDIPQLTGTMSGGQRRGTPWADLPDTDPDAAAAERVVRLPDVTTAGPADPDTRHDTETDIAEADTDTDVGSDPDTPPPWTKTDVGRQAAAMRRDGATLKEIAKRVGKDERTLSRWKLPKPDSTTPVSGHDLTGANN
jgi:hypothetical protein